MSQFHGKRIAVIVAGSALALVPMAAQYNALQKDRARGMVRDVADAMRKNYYDPAYHGIDMAARFKQAEAEVQNAGTFGEAYGAIADALEPLNDSHTFFLPPPRPIRREVGYVQRMIGDRCFITEVRPNTDASEKIAPGDEVVAWEGYKPARATLWKLSYAINELNALPVVHMGIRRPDGSTRNVEVTAKIRQEKHVLDLTQGGDLWQLIRDDENEGHLLRQRMVEFGDALMIWKMPEFDLADQEVDRLIKQARRHQTLVIDLRGNPGGLVKMLEYLVGSVSDHDVTIATRKGRKPGLKPQMAKTTGGAAFQGKLIVLVDSGSASAAELFARVVQLEHRGTVLGDRSSGSVMESRRYQFSQGADTMFFYGASITDADLIMADGKSLEHNGVTPDEVILPTAEDLAAGRDPVLSRAAAIAGVALDAVAAGKLFPVEWRTE